MSGADRGLTCGHVQLLSRDFANQPVPHDGACLLCERDTLESERHALSMRVSELESVNNFLVVKIMEALECELSSNNPSDCNAAYLSAIREVSALKEERDALANRVLALESALTDAYRIADEHRDYGEHPEQLHEIRDVCELALLAKSKPCETCNDLKGWTEIGGYWMPCPDCAKEKS